MRSLIEKIADALGVFSPIILLAVVCGCYLAGPDQEFMDGVTRPALERNRKYPEGQDNYRPAMDLLLLNKNP